ncbi:hypothetical protein MRB53_041533 [Persea americana]|nr:hypothetical protein MRB53_041533 [Persea americana]
MASASAEQASGIPPPTSKEPVPADGQVQSDTSKLKTLFSILKRFIGVTDIAAVRFSLPAQLLEPIPNLEYWHYLDRPETFAAIADSDNPEERMLACLRFWFTKDLKYVKGKPCKPYNSSLGEFFRCTWDVPRGGEGGEKSASVPIPAAAATASTQDGPVQVHFLTEQTSHHPPLSAYIYECPQKGISAIGYDQLSGKFTGTSIKVVPGNHNRGIFLNLHSRGDEEYQLTHPAAYLGGFLRGNLYVTVADTCYITCAQTGLRIILHYLEESYFGKTQNKVEGVLYRLPANSYSSASSSKSSDSKIPDISPDTASLPKLKDIPRECILARLEGNWTEKIYLTRGPTEFKKVAPADRELFIDLTPLFPAPKTCPPLDAQLPNESRRFWNDVTEAILQKQYSQATTYKQHLEERQRQRAAERAQAGREWAPRFFTTVVEPDGRPALSEEGRNVLAKLKQGDYQLAEPSEYGAI